MIRPAGSLFLQLFVLIAGFGSVEPANAQSAGGDTVAFSVDTDSSLIFWRGTEMWQTGKHEGTLHFSSGRLLLKNGEMVGGLLIADMNSIAITDMPEHEVIARRNLREHLESDDFFLTGKYPTAVFEIRRMVQLIGDSLKVSGDLTIRDVTKPIVVDAELDTTIDGRMRFLCDFVFDRFEWNVAYQGSYWERISSILDNSLVDKEIQLSVKVVLERSPIRSVP